MSSALSSDWTPPCVGELLATRSVTERTRFLETFFCFPEYFTRVYPLTDRSGHGARAGRVEQTPGFWFGGSCRLLGALEYYVLRSLPQRLLPEGSQVLAAFRYGKQVVAGDHP